MIRRWTAVVVATAIGCGGGGHIVQRPVHDLPLDQVISSVAGYETTDGRHHECVGKARLRRTTRPGASEAVGTGRDDEWQRYRECVDRRTGDDAGQRACSVLMPAGGDSRDDLTLRCTGESDLRVVPASTVRILDIGSGRSGGSPMTGAGIGIAVGALVVVVLVVALAAVGCGPGDCSAGE